MALRKLHEVIGFVKDSASLSKAFVRNFGDETLELEVALLRATNHNQSQIDDRAMDRMLLLVSDHSESVPFLVDCISMRLDKTRNHGVSLKTLFPIHRILCSNMHVRMARAFDPLLKNHDFWFKSKHDPFSDFLTNYTAYLHERAAWIDISRNRLEPIRFHDSKDKEGPTNQCFHILSKCQDFIVKVLNFTLIPSENLDSLVKVVLCTILEESFKVYESYSEEMKELFDTLFDLPIPERPRACGILRIAVHQSRDLRGFYEKCRESIGNERLEYPFVETIDMECMEALEQSLSITLKGSDSISNKLQRRFSSRTFCSTYQVLT